MSLTQKHLTDVCKQNCGAQTCRYLCSQPDSSKTQQWYAPMIYYCAKLTLQKQDIDDEVDSFKAECTKKGTDPWAQGHPLGNNCPGYLPLKAKKQGYDIDKK